MPRPGPAAPLCDEGHPPETLSWTPHVGLLTLLFTLVVLAVPQSRASTINWGSAFGTDVLMDASGQPLGGEFSFEIGSFQGGFVPTLLNLNDWAANWKVFDRAYDPTPLIPDDGDPEGWSEENQGFVGFADLTGPTAVTGVSSSPDADPSSFFPQGEVAYLWVYNSKNRDTNTEWALVTDGVSTGDLYNDWVFPDPADPGSFEWQLGDADLAVYGSLNGTTGGGDPFTIQTSLVPVPEPGSLLLLGVAAASGLLRRRRGVNPVIG